MLVVVVMRRPEFEGLQLDVLLGLRGRPRADRAPLPDRCRPVAYGSTGAVLCHRHGCAWRHCIDVAPADRALYCSAGCGRMVDDCPRPGAYG